LNGRRPLLVEDPHVERVRINFSWMLKLRWAAVCGQLLTVVGVAGGLGIELELAPLGAILAFETLSNAGLEWWFRSHHSLRLLGRSAGRVERLLAWVMIVDISLLSVLLYFTGGPTNPFSIFYLVNVVLAAVVLPAGWAWAVNLLAVGGFLAVSAVHLPLPRLEDWRFGTGMSASSTITQSAGLYFLGVLIALCAAAFFVVYFVTRVTGELLMRERELNEARQRKARSERLEALATLAAGAAHELASPLSTIAVVAKELEIDLRRRELGEEIVADARLVRDEVARCRVILDQMSVDVGQSRIESIGEHLIAEVIESALDQLTGRAAVEVHIAPELHDRKLFVAPRTVALALRGPIKNALDASRPGASVVVTAEVCGDELAVDVRDRGVGMTPEVVERAADPFFTTKEPGQGMGLGLFLARTVIDRMGGTLEFDSAQDIGTTARIRIPLERLLKKTAEA